MNNLLLILPPPPLPVNISEELSKDKVQALKDYKKTELLTKKVNLSMG